MYKHLLVAIDGSELAHQALEHGVKLATALKADLTIVTVSESSYPFVAGEGAVAFPVKEYQESVTKLALDVLAKAKSFAAGEGVDAKTIHIKEDYPADGILRAADDVACDLIVMASHGRRGLSRIVLGSQANQVVTHSKRPVLICR